METHHQQQMNREKGIEERQENKQVQFQPIITSSPPPQQNSQPSNSSSSSSPSHEFTFTISLHNSTSYNPSMTKFTNNDEENSKAPPNNSHFNPLAVDLSPADEIFFHGHLLPLHLLSHLPKSPSRSSTNSMDSFTLPIRELLEDDENHKESGSCSTSNRSNITIDNTNKNRGNRENRGNRGEDSNNNTERKKEGKSNNFTFSLFGLKKGLKGSKVRDGEEKENHHKNKKKKLRFDMIHALKKYLKMVQPMAFFKGKREKFRINGKCSYSYSGSVTPRNNDSNNSNKKNKKEFIRSWRGEYYSAPASMRTSPTNSGVLVATNNALMIPPPSDSTMEELQAAIQAAIAHCKNSIAKEEKLKC